MGSKRDLITMAQRNQFNRVRQEQSSDPQPSILDSTYGKPVPLNLHCKVFLSHSGKDKEFVRHLNKALCSSYQGYNIAFFDEETIPKGEAVSMENILAEARTSKLCVLVVTEDFFTYTQNPMLELEAFADEGVKLLPLFLTMSVDQFKEEDRRDGWRKKWREWPGVNLERWEHALSLVSTFSGLERCKTARSDSEFIDVVVKEVTRLIGPAIPWTKGGVIHGKDRLCQMMDAMYKEAASKHVSSAQNVSNTAASTSTSNCGFEEAECCSIASTVLVGIHGFPGVGKTTLSKWLCDFYYPKLSGRVFYIDVGSPSEQNPATSSRGRLQHVIRSLSPCSKAIDCLPNLDDHRLENVLRAEFKSMKDPVFLAIDNILLDEKSQEEADRYLGCEFPKGSRIFITSRSKDILVNIRDQHECNFPVVIADMPSLEFEEVRDMLVKEFPHLRKLGITNQQELDDVNECVKLCTMERQLYHPLMLKSLAAYIRGARSTRNVDWKGRMAELRLKGIGDNKRDVWSKVFTVFEMVYGLLSGEARKVFLDLALFQAFIYRQYLWMRTDLYLWEWIKVLHSHLGEKKLLDIIWQLQETCFIERGGFEIPKLMQDFAEDKAQKEDTYLVMDDRTVWPDLDRLPSSARHISISRVSCTASELDLRDVEGVEVLHLMDNPGLQEVLLSRTTCAHPRVHHITLYA